MVDNRTISAITPVDERTSDVRFMVYIGRKPGATTRSGRRPRRREFGEEVIRQFAQDVHIWQHQRYSDPPALANAEQKGFTAIRKWAKQVLSRRPRRQRRRSAYRIRERPNRLSVNPADRSGCSRWRRATSAAR